MSIYDSFSENELEILQARAEHAARASRDKLEGVIIAVLGVSVYGEKYALPVELLTAVYSQMPVVPVPCVSSFVAGVANIRGRIFTVLDLGVLLSTSETSASSQFALVVAANEEMSIAFKVTSVGEITTFVADDLSPVPANFDTARPEYLEGVFPDGTVLLDVNAILGDSRLVVNQEPRT